MLTCSWFSSFYQLYFSYQVAWKHLTGLMSSSYWTLESPGVASQTAGTTSRKYNYVAYGIDFGLLQKYPDSSNEQISLGTWELEFSALIPLLIRSQESNWIELSEVFLVLRPEGWSADLVALESLKRQRRSLPRGDAQDAALCVLGTDLLSKPGEPYLHSQFSPLG